MNWHRTYFGKTLLIVSLAAFSLGLGTPLSGQAWINRRDQARGLFLGNPKSVFQHYCAPCHGDDGKGGGRFWATELSPPPTDLTTLKVGKKYLLEAIREGSAKHGKSPLCPPWGRTISPSNIERLARYILSLGDSQTILQSTSPEARDGFPAEPFSWFLTVLIVGEIIFLGFLAWGRKTES